MLHNAVNRLEDLAWVVNVVQFAKRIAGRVPGEVLIGMLRLQLLIAGLCRCEGVVSVTHGIKETGIRVLLPLALFIIRDSALQRAFFLPVHQPAGYVSAAQHQLKIVQLLQAVPAGGQGLDHLTAFVVAEQQDVRQLQRGPSSDRHAGRNPLGHRLLGRAHGGIHRAAVVVLFQVHHADEAAAYLSAVQRAFDIDEAVAVCPQEAPPDIVRHRLMDVFDGPLGGRKPALRQDQVSGRGHALGQAVDLFPVLGLGRKLITCNDCPALQIAVLRKENIGSTEAVMVL